MQESQVIAFHPRVIKEEFCIDDACFVAQKCELETTPKSALSNISTNSMDSTLANMSVVIKEELILEDIDGENLMDKVLYTTLLIMLY